GDWGDLDVLILDMPAGSDDVTGAALEHVPLDGGVFVTTPFDASVTDTRRTVELFEENGVPPVSVVVNMNRFTCECCGESNTMFEDAVDFDVPAVHDLPFDRRLQRDPGRGSAPDALEDVATTVESYLHTLDREVPTDAIDLRGLPVASQARQLLDDLAVADSGETVQAVVEDPTQLEQDLMTTAGEILDDVRQSQPGTVGAVVELTSR
ncbi:MAG: P-loop NTPase, partial [archaeon]